MRQPAVVASIEIAARPANVYRFIADVSRWHLFMAETQAPAGLPESLEPGTTFRAWNSHGPWWWRTSTRVVQADQDRHFAFEVTCLGRPVSAWRYDIVPTAYGCRVTESTRDLRGRLVNLVSVLGTGVVDRAARNQRNMGMTLARLKAAVEQSA